MVEAPGESTHVWSHKVRATLLRSVMRHFAQSLENRNFRVDYRRLDTQGAKTLADGRCAALQEYRPQRLIGVVPGDFRVCQQFEDAITLLASYAINTGPRGNTVRLAVRPEPVEGSGRTRTGLRPFDRLRTGQAQPERIWHLTEQYWV